MPLIRFVRVMYARPKFGLPPGGLQVSTDRSRGVSKQNLSETGTRTQLQRFQGPQCGFRRCASLRYCFGTVGDTNMKRVVSSQAATVVSSKTFLPAIARLEEKTNVPEFEALRVTWERAQTWLSQLGERSTFIFTRVDCLAAPYILITQGRPNRRRRGPRCNRTSQRPGSDNNHTIWSFSGPGQLLSGPENFLEPENDFRTTQ